MVECLVFDSIDDMQRILGELLKDFPNAKGTQTFVSNSSTFQVGLDFGAVDEPTLLGWAVQTNNLNHCVTLVLTLLEEPRPFWVTRFLRQLDS